MNTTAGTRARPGRVWAIGLWVLAVLGAASFLMAGFQKISSDPQMVQMFSLIGVGSWFRYLTGTLEILGAIALVIPRLRVLGALGLVGLMIGAIIPNSMLRSCPPSLSCSSWRPWHGAAGASSTPPGSCAAGAADLTAVGPVRGLT